MRPKSDELTGWILLFSIWEPWLCRFLIPPFTSRPKIEIFFFRQTIHKRLSHNLLSHLTKKSKVNALTQLMCVTRSANLNNKTYVPHYTNVSFAPIFLFVKRVAACKEKVDRVNTFSKKKLLHSIKVNICQSFWSWVVRKQTFCLSYILSETRLCIVLYCIFRLKHFTLFKNKWNFIRVKKGPKKEIFFRRTDLNRWSIENWFSLLAWKCLVLQNSFIKTSF